MPIIGRTSRRVCAVLVVALCLAALAALSGPLFPFTPAPSNVADVVGKAADLDGYLREREALHSPIKPELAKAVLWNDPAARDRTPLSLVYLHGFSASRKDITPVVERLASTFAANAFLTRLAAHGRMTSGEFATVTAQDWLDDAREALAVGRRIGDRVILIGTSTGALLATMVALEDNSPRIAALVLLSPNFGLRDWRTQFISGPLGPLLARILVGTKYSFHPDTSGHAQFWTSRYPSHAIVALMNLVNHARSLRLGNLEIPTLILYTDKDTVVDTAAIERRFDEIHASSKLIINLPGASRHELTGDALAPETVGPVIARVTSFLASIGIVQPGAPKAGPLN
jgi:alpha-beta hydrolase superfamily lysophospholipase